METGSIWVAGHCRLLKRRATGLSGPIPLFGIRVSYFRRLDWRALLNSVSGVHFLQVFFVKPPGCDELGVYPEEGWMPTKNAVIVTLKK